MNDTPLTPQELLSIKEERDFEKIFDSLTEEELKEAYKDWDYSSDDHVSPEE